MIVRHVPREYHEQRDCPLACSFCGASRLLGDFREKPAQDIRRELAAIRVIAPNPFIQLADHNTFAGARDFEALFDVLEDSASAVSPRLTGGVQQKRRHGDNAAGTLRVPFAAIYALKNAWTVFRKRRGKSGCGMRSMPAAIRLSLRLDAEAGGLGAKMAKAAGCRLYGRRIHPPKFIHSVVVGRIF